MWSRVVVRNETLIRYLPVQEHVTDFHNVSIEGNFVNVHIHPSDFESAETLREMLGTLHPVALASTTLPKPFQLRVWHSPLSCASTSYNGSIYFIKPYHVNNMAHLFNENVLPLVETMQFPQDRSRTLVTYPAHGTGGHRALPIWHQMLQSLRISTTSSDNIREGCVKHFVWGLGIKPFWHAHRIIQTRRTLVRLRMTLFPALGLRYPSQSADTMICIRRTSGSQRSLPDESFALVASAMNSTCNYCCDFRKITLRDQIRLISRASVMIGLHGAGLMNVIFAKKKAVLVELFGSKGITWAVHRRAVQSIHGGYVGVRVTEQRAHHSLNLRHAVVVRECVTAVRNHRHHDCLRLPYVMGAVSVDSTWDCRNEGEAGDALPCTVPTWQEPPYDTSTDGECVRLLHGALSLIDPNRCSRRAETLTQAFALCKSHTRCDGVTRDNGIMCGDVMLQYELRRLPLLHGQGMSWVVKKRCS